MELLNFTFFYEEFENSALNKTMQFVCDHSLIYIAILLITLSIASVISLKTNRNGFALAGYTTILGLLIPFGSFFVLDTFSRFYNGIMQASPESVFETVLFIMFMFSMICLFGKKETGNV